MNSEKETQDANGGAAPRPIARALIVAFIAILALITAAMIVTAMLLAFLMEAPRPPALMIKTAILFSAVGFYVSLASYILAELYYNHTYWRLVLKKRRRVRWEVSLWLLRAAIVLFGLGVIVLISLKN